VAVIMPALCIWFIGMGLATYKLEEDINDIWVRDSSDLKKNEDYKNDIVGGATMSAQLTISIPHAGGNVLTAPYLLDMVEHLAYTENISTVVDGITFTFEDGCVQPINYQSPCLRISVLDCFKEGGRSMTAAHVQSWQQSAADTAVEGFLPGFREPITSLAFAEAGECNCTAASVSHGIFDLFLGSFTSEGSCRRCMQDFYPSQNAGFRDVMYYLGLASMSGVDNRDPSFYDNWLRNAVRDWVIGMAQAGKWTPYDFPMDTLRRPALNDSGVLLNESEVLAAASKTCYLFDGGAFLPPVQPTLVFGAPQPADFNETNPLTHVSALQHVHSLEVPEGMIAKMTSQYRPGGPIDGISYDQARRALEDLKKQFEDRVSEFWDNPSAGPVQYVSFSDDQGVIGTFGRVLPEVAESAMPLAFVYSGVTILFSIFMFMHHQCSLSRTLLVAVGAIYAILATYGALGLIAWMGVEIEVVQMWTIPFLMLGIGVDDMYILTLAEESVPPLPTVEDTFAAAFASVALPITMTSLVNTGMFLVLALGVDLPAVYQAGYTGLIAAAMLFLTVFISFPSILYLDMKRRAAGRWDWACCIRSKTEEGRAATEEKALSPSSRRQQSGESVPEVATSPSSGDKHQLLQRRRNRLFAAIYTWAYKPLVTTWIGWAAVLGLAVALLIFSVLQYSDIPVGLNLVDFFPDDHQAGRYSELRQIYFPSWPIAISWGQMAYEDPNIQLRMARQLEDVLTVPTVAAEGVQTSTLWTAALALWAVPPEYGLSACMPSDSFTRGRCGPVVDQKCTATWVANTYNLRLASQGGICYLASDLGLVSSTSSDGSYCPVLSGLTQREYADCVASWKKSSLQYNVIGPSLPMEADGETFKVPIQYSEFTSLFGINLYETDDYVDMIEDTRRYVDDDSSMWAWMSGIPYNYWEQYLTVVDTLLWIGITTVLAGWAIGMVFLFLELTFQSRGTLLARAIVSLTGSFLISLMSLLSLGVVVAFCAWNNVRMSGFTAMSCVLSIGFSVEYSVHVVHRYLEAPKGGSTAERVDHAMQWLFHPVSLAFLTTLVSVLMLSFSDLYFVRTYFFKPLLVATCASFFFGGIFMPVVLQLLTCLPTLEVQSVAATPKEMQTPAAPPAASQPPSNAADWQVSEC